jgi:glycoside/pentoside/hexuronide:cation symporter, GPH family
MAIAPATFAPDVNVGSPVGCIQWRGRDGLYYGLLGFPLAFCALPLYILLPNLYAREFGVGLSALGGVLLGARLLDAVIDPMLGRWCDHLYRRSLDAVQTFGGVAAGFLATGFALLFFPPTRGPQGLLIWAFAMLVLTYTAFSALSLAHQSWGAMLGGNEVMRSRVVAWREGLGLVGVVVAATLPTLMGLASMVGLLGLGLLAGWMAWRAAVRPSPNQIGHGNGSLWRPWQISGFRRLLLVFSVNGIASAVPATLVLFFVQDLLRASESIQPLFLGGYFLSGALSMPLWLHLVRRKGLATSWLIGMALAIVIFLSALRLGPGDTWPFLVVCLLSGIALGSDLALPGALLAGVIDKAKHRGVAEGAYFGWWNFASKLNLALAAGVTLPLLQWLGYAPGAQDPQALRALTLTYCLLPCVLKAVAALALYVLIIHPSKAKNRVTEPASS